MEKLDGKLNFSQKDKIDIDPEKNSGEHAQKKITRIIEKDEPEKYLKNLEILKTFSFHDDNERFVESLKKSFETIDLNGLEKSAFVNIEIKARIGGRQDFVDVDIAENIISKNEAEKILMYAFSDLDSIRQSKSKIDLLLSKENIKFLRLPFTPEDAINAVRNQASEQISGERLQQAQDKEIGQKVSLWLHIVDRDPQKVTSEAKEFFPALVDKSDKEIIDFLQNIRQNVPEVMKGQNIEGVFCDIEGTLFNGEELNTATLEKLKEFEAQGKTITLWTDGDVSNLQKLLDKEGIIYPLKSKVDHAGASAEIVIDNDDQNTFSAMTKIYAKKFIKI